MSLDNQMSEALKMAMKAKDQIRMMTLRSIKAAFLLAKTAEGASGELTDDEELKIIQKLYKQRSDSMQIYKEQGRDDLAGTEEAEMKVISEFLPAQMSDDELKLIIQSIISQTGAQSMQDMGKVMGQAMAKVGGQADGKRISAAVKELLA